MIPGEVRLVNGMTWRVHDMACMAWQHGLQFCFLATRASVTRCRLVFSAGGPGIPDRIQPKLMAWLGIRSVPNMGMARRSPKAIIFEHP